MSDEQRRRSEMQRKKSEVQGDRGNKKKKKKKFSAKKKKKIAIRVGILCIVLLVFFISMGIVYVNKILNKVNNVTLNKENLGIASEEELSDYDEFSKIKNIALFGVDSADGVGRSDAMMIATIDPVHDKLKITSLMRDSYVDIGDRGYDKLNHAYAFGGPELAINTINKTFGLNIEEFVSVDFSSLPKIIDIFGGIELDITEEEITCDININDYINGVNEAVGTSANHITKPGVQQVNGVQALAYSRIRYASGGDYQRTQRQRTVLAKVFEKAIALSPTKYPKLIDEILPYVQTNLEGKEILSLATKVVSIGAGNLEQDRFPRDGDAWGDTVEGIYYLMFDEENVKQQMRDYIFDDK